MSKELVASIVSFVVVFLRPYLADWGLPEILTGDLIAFVAAGVYTACSALQYGISKVPALSGPAAIAVSIIEESMATSPNDVKKTAAYEKLCQMIDAMNLGKIQKWLLKQGAPMAIEAIVKQAKTLLYRNPPEEPPKVIPATA